MTDFWIGLWKTVFVVGFGLFLAMAVWVTIAGGRDVKRLLAGLREKKSKQ